MLMMLACSFDVVWCFFVASKSLAMDANDAVCSLAVYRQIPQLGSLLLPRGFEATPN